jgi:hypothetical protein
MSIDGRGLDCLAAGKLAPGNLGLLQQYLHNVSSVCIFGEVNACPLPI